MTTNPILNQPIDVKGLTVVVTGAAKGIGAAIARAYVEKGANVIGVDIDRAALQELYSQIAAAREAEQHGRFFPFEANLASPAGIKRNFPRLAAFADKVGGGKLDVLIANAGLIKTMPKDQAATIATTPVEELDMLYRLHMAANFSLYQGLSPLLQKSSAPKLIVTSSPIVGRADPATVAYAMTKGALESLAQNIAAEQAANHWLVTAIDPGRVQTALRAEVRASELAGANPSPDHIVSFFLAAGSRGADRALWHGHTITVGNIEIGNGNKDNVQTAGGYLLNISRRPLNKAGAAAEIIDPAFDSAASMAYVVPVQHGSVARPPARPIDAIYGKPSAALALRS